MNLQHLNAQLFELSNTTEAQALLLASIQEITIKFIKILVV